MRRAVLISICLSAACGPSTPPPPPAETPHAPATPATPAAPAPDLAAASTAPTTLGNADADAPSAGFEVNVIVTDGGRGRAALVSLDGKPVKTLRELTRQLQRI